MGLGSMLRGILFRPGAPGGGRAATGAAGPVSAAGRPSDAWRGLPAIQRAVGPVPLVAPNSVFKSGLAAAKPAPTALAPLGHERGLEAPAGLVTGLAAPVQRAVDPVPLSVRRPGRPGRSPIGGAEADPETVTLARLADTSPNASTVYPAFGANLDDPDLGAPAAGAWTAPSAGVAPVVARRTDASPLTVARLVDPVPGGRVGHAASAHQPVQSPPGRSSFPGSGLDAGESVTREAASASSLAVRGFAPPAPGASAGAAAPPAQGASAGAAAPASSTMSSPAAAPAPIVARSADAARANLGQSRRLRIGAALAPGSGTSLTGAHATAAERGSVPARDTLGGRSVQRHPAGPGSSAEPGGASATSPDEHMTAPEGVPISREVTWAVPPSTPEELVPDPAEPARGGPAVVARQQDRGLVPIRPLSAHRLATAPLVGTLQPVMTSASPAVAVRVQTEPEHEAPEEPGSPAAALAALARMDHGAGLQAPGGAWEPSEWAGDEAARPRLFSGPGTAAIPFAAARRAPTSAPVPTAARSIDSPTAGASPASPAARGLASPRATGGRLAVGRSTVSPAMPALQRTMTWDPINGMTVSASAAAPSAPALSTTPAAAPAAPAWTGASAGPAPHIAPLVARSFDGGSGDEVIQRQEAAAPTATATASEGAAGAATGATSTMPEAQLDDLARRLHDRIAARISHDLLVERERSGSLVDQGW